MSAVSCCWFRSGPAFQIFREVNDIDAMLPWLSTEPSDFCQDVSEPMPKHGKVVHFATNFTSVNVDLSQPVGKCLVGSVVSPTPLPESKEVK